jgi:hypothetical protein
MWVAPSLLPAAARFCFSDLLHPPRGPDRGPHVPDGRRPIAWLHIITPSAPRMPPRAYSRYDCGRNLSARGRPRVLALIENHTGHRQPCPPRTRREGRTAA